ncbi:hypothetical protein ACXITP_04735 [Actinotignum sanguinis]|uniref:Uncharacterized protein n=1 Tax=Schaalia turicensis TaxID=131111 RepID=A0ABZ0RA79_9ACTO|nr:MULTISPECIES: hypothetical protein [Actinotignum]WPJ88578.1 hypothetical protein R0V15_06825 [Schaalia turicensis]MDE1553723.1 hypothetical protein [Actinotignum sanguinis]MDE1566434.1 hypothetical protein [Actinotignum sanguinis]MDE1578053.1 hypothetical protein [Actinotignum sanguinis]MDE1643090.1 hypothetical protein [Actinotignum sanguinis]
MSFVRGRKLFPDLTFTSLEDVLKRKEEILREVRMTREEFDQRADNYQLGPDESDAYFEMVGLDRFEEYYRGERTLG